LLLPAARLAKPHDENKELFIRIFDAFLAKHQFELPTLLQDNTEQPEKI